MNPQQWGSCVWRTIHVIALGYPKHPNTEQKEAYKQFYENLWKVLPCYACSINYQRHLKELPLEPYLENDKTLFEWTVILHNVVNKELGKQSMSLQEARSYYIALLNLSSMPPKRNEQDSVYLWILVAIVLILLFYIIWSHTIKTLKYNP